LVEVQKQLEAFLTEKQRAQERSTPLEKARMQLTLAHAINALFYMFLKTQGVTPEDHPVTEELRRLELYLKKVDEAEAKLRSSSGQPASVDVEAASRLLAEVLPDKGAEKETTKDRSTGQLPSKKKRRKSKEATQGDGAQGTKVAVGQVGDLHQGTKKKSKRDRSKKEQN